MERPITRKLTEREQALRLACIVLDKPHNDPDGDMAVLSRQLLRTNERLQPLTMDKAPRDGTHILAYLYRERDDANRDFGEWREIWWKPYRSLGMDMPWHAGDPADSHSGGPAPEHFGDGVPVAFVWLPEKPNGYR